MITGGTRISGNLHIAKYSGINKSKVDPWPTCSQSARETAARARCVRVPGACACPHMLKPKAVTLQSGAPVVTKSRQVGVHITPITMVYGTRVYQPTNITGGPHIVMHLGDHPLDQSAGYWGYKPLLCVTSPGIENLSPRSFTN